MQRVQLRHSSMERCENISIATVNGICTEAAYSTDDCNVSYIDEFHCFLANEHVINEITYQMLMFLFELIF